MEERSLEIEWKRDRWRSNKRVNLYLSMESNLTFREIERVINKIRASSFDFMLAFYKERSNETH